MMEKRNEFLTPSGGEQTGLDTDLHFMAEALRQARKAFRADEVPVGAVVVAGGRVIARAHNQVESLRDATAHAEMIAITQAESAVGDWRLSDCTLYVTKEPCPMCAGALVLSRMGRVVFGCPDPKSGGAGGMINLLQHPSLNHRCEVSGGVALDDCRSLLVSFFQAKRAADPSPDPGALPGAGPSEAPEAVPPL